MMYRLSVKTVNRVPFIFHRSLQFCISLVLACALMLSSLTIMRTQAQKQQNDKSYELLISLIEDASGLAKDDSIRSDLKRATQALMKARKGDDGSKEVAQNLETARGLLSKIVDDPRGESADFQDRITKALKLSYDIAAEPADQRRPEVAVPDRRPILPVRPTILTPTPSPDPPDCNAPESSLDCDGNPRTSSGTSQPAAQLRGRFRVTLNGFRVNHQTYQGLWAAWDAVSLYPNVQMVNATGEMLSNLTLRGSTTTIGSTPENTVRGGSASANGGFRTGDAFPTQTPWQRTEPGNTNPARRAVLPIVYFEGELIQNTNAAYIIPTIWEIDGRDNLDLLGGYQAQIDHDLPRLRLAVANMIRGRQPLTLASYLRRGSSMGLGISLRLPIGVPQNRPIGMEPERDQFGFIPQVLVLTYDSADFMSRSTLGGGLGVGIVPIRYVDPEGFAGDYTLFFQVDRINP